jgi:hypothetical protein
LLLLQNVTGVRIALIVTEICFWGVLSRVAKESTSYVGWLVCFITLETCAALGDGESDSSKMKVLHLIYNLDAEFRH